MTTKMKRMKRKINKGKSFFFVIIAIIIVERKERIMRNQEKMIMDNCSSIFI
jgi:hypothetical protein